MARRKKSAGKHSRATGCLITLVVIVCIAGAGYLLRNRIAESLSPPPRADLNVLNAAVDSACASLETRKSSSTTVDLGDHQIAQDRLELPGSSSLLRANLIITRAVETAGGTVSYGIESVDEKRRWQSVTLGITDGDSLIREVRLERRLR
jgi:hypothetical protein